MKAEWRKLLQPKAICVKGRFPPLMQYIMSRPRQVAGGFSVVRVIFSYPAHVNCTCCAGAVEVVIYMSKITT